MRRLITRALISSFILFIVIGTTSTASLFAANRLSPALPVAAEDEPAALQADHDLSAALEKTDRRAVGALLDSDFAWTSVDGKMRGKTETLENLNDLATDSGENTSAKTLNYGQVEIIIGTHQNRRFTRIWVERQEAWRALIFLDLATDAGFARGAPQVSAKGGAERDCENPCRTIPYKPLTPADQAMASAWQKMRTDEWHPNPDEWGYYVADEWVTVTGRADLPKVARVSAIAKQKAAGATPAPADPVSAMRIFDFGNSAVMWMSNPTSAGTLTQSVRVWVFRDGRWQVVLTEQTPIQADARM